jgi:hypothetical protein
VLRMKKTVGPSSGLMIMVYFSIPHPPTATNNVKSPRILTCHFVYRWQTSLFDLLHIMRVDSRRVFLSLSTMSLLDGRSMDFTDIQEDKLTCPDTPMDVTNWSSTHSTSGIKDLSHAYSGGFCLAISR